MGEARRRRQRAASALAALQSLAIIEPGEPVEVTAREAARFYADRTHIALVFEKDNQPDCLFWNALLAVYGATLRVVAIVPALDRTLPRPNVRAISPTCPPPEFLKAQKVYPELVIGFLVDNVANRQMVDALARLVAAALGSPAPQPIVDFPERGPVVRFHDPAESTLVAFSLLEQLEKGNADDWSVN